MNRRLALCSAAAFAAAVAPAASAHRGHPLIEDPKGDWHVASQDIVSGGLATDRAGRLVATLKLAAPLAEVPGSYYVVFVTGCVGYIAALDWRGPAVPSTGELRVEGCPGVAGTTTTTAHPATVTVAGDTVTWTLPARPELERGTSLGRPWAIAAPNPVALVGLYTASTHTPPQKAEAFDLAVATHPYRVGDK